ncbi:MAG: hypothetical protein Q4D27_00185 [Coriobacteriia bacterium]|nr:hypothetical protein [Coriobacteriia bacterium]
MATIPRERIALIVFIACIAIILAGIGAYLYAGHSWNYAATRIDDAAGEMDGYKVVLYEGIAIPESPQVDSRGMLRDHPVSLDAAKRDYANKGATVFTLNTHDMDSYEHPRYFEKNGYRVAVLYIPTDATPARIDELCDDVASHSVQASIAITPSATWNAGDNGFDAIIELESDAALAAGYGDSDSYMVKMPAAGSVGAILISPSELLSARTR